MASEIDRTLCDVLAGRRHPSNLTLLQLEEVMEHATANGVVELLSHNIMGTDRQIDGAIHRRARRTLRTAAVTAMLRRNVLRALIDAFEANAIRMLLLKGAGLAYTVYREPHLRPAVDIDLFIAHEDLAHADRALRRAGFSRLSEPDSQSASMQRHYVYAGAFGETSFVDLHWQIANRHLFAKALTFADAWDASQPAPRLGQNARTLGTADALFLACLHRVAHHDDEPHLVWLWDIHLLTAAMTGADMKTLAARAQAGGMCAVVMRGLELSRQRFGTEIDESLNDALTRPGLPEASASFIGGRSRNVVLVLRDLSAVATTSARIRLLREHFFPDRIYMRAKYPACPAPLLPAVYLYRIARGARKWLRRDPSPTSLD